jgi:hypothetical protein
VGIKQSHFFVDTLALNDRIITHVENKFEYEGYRQIMGIAKIGSEVVAEVTLQVIRTETTD